MADGDHPDERGHAPSRVGTVAALAVLAIVLMLLAGAAAGPWNWPDPGLGSTGTGGEEMTPFFPTFPTPETVPEGEDLGAPPAGGNAWVRWLVIATVAAIGVLIILLLVRLVLALRRGTVPPPDPREVGTPGADELVDAPAIQEGIAAAQQALASERPPRDAIVRAWMALEEAAGEAGVARRPAQTPTEFAVVVLARTEADDDAVAVLRRLYTRSRFSEAEITRDDATQAHVALERIAASWAAVQVPR